MPEKILDLHIHSKYSRACSQDLELPKIAAACARKGIDICSTGDFTHPGWLAHIKENLKEEKGGVYSLKTSDLSFKTKFILGTEVAVIKKHKGETRRLHLCIYAPSIETVEEFNSKLEARGANLSSDGRPILGLTAKELLELMLEIDEHMLMIPAHAWTPWFAVFGSKSGYDSLEDCFEELTPHIKAIETGLSSDPPMNHRLSALDNITLVSNSDAHSLDKLGREANVLSFTDEGEITYDEIRRTISTGDRAKFLYTIEFYPEEGKYHADGHAVCKVCLTPRETKRNKSICPVCKKPLTVGVLYRVEELADRLEEKIPSGKFIPHKYIVPLREVIAQVLGVGPASKRVASEYDNLISNLGNEFKILLSADLEEIGRHTDSKNIALAIDNMRSGAVSVSPGYDGIFGRIELINPSVSNSRRQTTLL